MSCSGGRLVFLSFFPAMFLWYGSPLVFFSPSQPSSLTLSDDATSFTSSLLGYRALTIIFLFFSLSLVVSTLHLKRGIPLCLSLVLGDDDWQEGTCTGFSVIVHVCIHVLLSSHPCSQPLYPILKLWGM